MQFSICVLYSHDISVQKNESIESVKTAHSTFKENSIDCMALSRRGLFVAGKVCYFKRK